MPKNKNRRKPRTESENPSLSFFKKILWGSVFSSASFFALLLILALITVKASISDSMQNIFVFFSALLSTFTGSFISLRKTREKGLVSGLLTAFPAAVFVCLVLLCVLHTLGLRTLLMSVLMLIGGALGGIAAVNK